MLSILFSLFCSGTSGFVSAVSANAFEGVSCMKGLRSYTKDVMSTPSKKKATIAKNADLNDKPLVL